MKQASRQGQVSRGKGEAQPTLHKPRPVSFRLKPDVHLLLTERADLLGTRTNKLARHYVLEMLQAEAEREALRTVVLEMQQELVQLRRDFAQAVETLLVSAGSVEEKDAQAWVDENFR